MAAPLDRIRHALKDPEQIARFDRALALLADEIEAVKVTHSSRTPTFAPRFHDGHLLDVDITVRHTVR